AETGCYAEWSNFSNSRIGASRSATRTGSIHMASRLTRARPGPTPSIHNTEPITMNDVIIIGGSFAGLAGALQLGRARRKVTVLDTGLPRNRFAGHSHGLLGQ